MFPALLHPKSPRGTRLVAKIGSIHGDSKQSASLLNEVQRTDPSSLTQSRPRRKRSQADQLQTPPSKVTRPRTVSFSNSKKTPVVFHIPTSEPNEENEEDKDDMFKTPPSSPTSISPNNSSFLFQFSPLAELNLPDEVLSSHKEAARKTRKQEANLEEAKKRLDEAKNRQEEARRRQEEAKKRQDEPKKRRAAEEVANADTNKGNVAALAFLLPERPQKSTKIALEEEASRNILRIEEEAEARIVLARACANQFRKKASLLSDIASDKNARVISEMDSPIIFKRQKTVAAIIANTAASSIVSQEKANHIMLASLARAERDILSIQAEAASRITEIRDNLRQSLAHYEQAEAVLNSKEEQESLSVSLAEEAMKQNKSIQSRIEEAQYVQRESAMLLRKAKEEEDRKLYLLLQNEHHTKTSEESVMREEAKKFREKNSKVRADEEAKERTQRELFQQEENQRKLVVLEDMKRQKLQTKAEQMNEAGKQEKMLLLLKQEQQEEETRLRREQQRSASHAKEEEMKTSELVHEVIKIQEQERKVQADKKKNEQKLAAEANRRYHEGEASRLIQQARISRQLQEQEILSKRQEIIHTAEQLRLQQQEDLRRTRSLQIRAVKNVKEDQEKALRELQVAADKLKERERYEYELARQEQILSAERRHLEQRKYEQFVVNEKLKQDDKYSANRIQKNNIPSQLIAASRELKLKEEAERSENIKKAMEQTKIREDALRREAILASMRAKVQREEEERLRQQVAKKVEQTKIREDALRREAILTSMRAKVQREEEERLRQQMAKKVEEENQQSLATLRAEQYKKQHVQISEEPYVEFYGHDDPRELEGKRLAAISNLIVKIEQAKADIAVRNSVALSSLSDRQQCERSSQEQRNAISLIQRERHAFEKQFIQ